MPTAFIVSTAIFVRRSAVVAVLAAILGGCHSRKPVTAPAVGGIVRIQYSDSGAALTVQTARHGLVVLPRVRTVEARILELRADSVNVRVIWTTPNDSRVYQGSGTIARPGDRSHPQQWTEKKFSRRRTIALFVIPPVVFLGAVAIALGTSDSW